MHLLNSSPQVTDPLLREAGMEGAAAIGKGADHVPDEGVVPPVA